MLIVPGTFLEAHTSRHIGGNSDMQPNDIAAYRACGGHGWRLRIQWSRSGNVGRKYRYIMAFPMPLHGGCITTEK